VCVCVCVCADTFSGNAQSVEAERSACLEWSRCGVTHDQRGLVCEVWCVTCAAAEVVHRAPITWLGKICGVLVAMTVMLLLLLPFLYVFVFP
jgi:hypothetical protein